jgi:hypothetical protein
MTRSPDGPIPVTLVILCNHDPKFNLGASHALSGGQICARKDLPMNPETKVSPQGSDWTRLLTDPDLVSHLGQLLQTYREVSPEKREAALLQAMRKIKEGMVKEREQESEKVHASQQKNDADEVQATSSQGAHDEVHVAIHHKDSDNGSKPAGILTQHAAPAPPVELHSPEPIDEAPPFETDFLDPDVAAPSDRRRFQRLKCYVAVEIHIEGIAEPVWGNLANVSSGGCLVETASAVPHGKVLEIGLWVASGKIWVKGVIITGIATRSASFGVRVKFSQSELSEKQHLREFLKFVENTARKSHSGNAYLTQLKS